MSHNQYFGALRNALYFYLIHLGEHRLHHVVKVFSIEGAPRLIDFSAHHLRKLLEKPIDQEYDSLAALEHYSQA